MARRQGNYRRPGTSSRHSRVAVSGSRHPHAGENWTTGRVNLERIETATTDGLAILHRECYEGQPERIAALEEAWANDATARKIQKLRTRAGLTQAQLAKSEWKCGSGLCVDRRRDPAGCLWQGYREGNGDPVHHPDLQGRPDLHRVHPRTRPVILWPHGGQGDLEPPRSCPHLPRRGRLHGYAVQDPRTVGLSELRRRPASGVLPLSERRILMVLDLTK